MWMALGRKDSLSLPPRDNPLSLTVLLQLVVVSWEGPNTLIDHYPRLTSTLLGQGEEDAVGRSGSSLVNCIADKYECLRMISPRNALTQLRQSLKVTVGGNKDNAFISYCKNICINKCYQDIVIVTLVASLIVHNVPWRQMTLAVTRLQSKLSLDLNK